jgi:acyl-CoA thioesterase FadM
MTAKCQRATELVRKVDSQLLARARTTWGFIETTGGRPRRIPEEIRVAFDPYVHAEAQS